MARAAKELRDLLAELGALVGLVVAVAGVAVAKVEDRAVRGGRHHVRAVGLSRGNGHSVELRHC